MPRPERLLDPSSGPLARFAADLRRLRLNAGQPSYRTLAAKSGYSVTALSEAAGGRDLPSLAVTRAYVEVCGGDPAQWEQRWQDLADQLRLEQPAAHEDPSRCPYLGLATFQPQDADRFVGREHLAADLVERLAATRFLIVFGPSGSGKSSLLRAGLIPTITEWHPVLFTPGEHPLEEYERQLAMNSASTRVLLVVDQFEEVFTLCRDRGERTAFIRGLRDASRDAHGRTSVVLGVRADFYARCAVYPELVEAMNNAAVTVGPLSSEDLQRAIVEPARRLGLTVERAIVAAVVRDAAGEPGALPLVSHALLETWRRRRGNALTLAGYEAAGGVRGALVRTAEAAYHRLDEDQRRTAHQVFVRLVALGDGSPDTRRRVNRAELHGGQPEATEAVVEQLAAARLITLDGPTLELAHDTLIDAWPRFSSWLREDRQGLRTHRRLTEAAAQWHSLGRDTGTLYRGIRLALSQAWAKRPAQPPVLSTLEREFLDASIAAEATERSAALRRERLRRRMLLALSGLLVLTIGLSGVAVWQWQAAVHQRQIAISRQLAAESYATAKLDVDRSMRLAVQAYDAEPGVEARSALLSIAGYQPYQARLVGHAGLVKAVAFTPDGRILASASQDRTVLLWDVTRQAQIGVLRGHDDAVRALAISPDGRLLATAGRDRKVILWDLAQRRALRTMLGHTDILDGIAFSPDGRWLASAGADNTTIIWDVGTGAERMRLTGYGGLMTEVAFSPDGRVVATAGDDGSVALWDLATGRPRVLPASTAGIYAVAFSPDGHLLAAAGAAQTISLWDVDRGAQVATLSGHTNSVRGLAFSADGRLLVSAGYDRRAIVWDVAQRAQVTVLTGHATALYGVAISVDGRYIASAGDDETVMVWDRAQMPLAGHTGWVADVAYSPDGRLLATSGNDTTARLWDPATHQPQMAWPAIRGTKTPGVAAVAFTRDGRTLITAGEDAAIRLWDAATGAEVGTLTGHREPVTAVAVSPDGQIIASAGGHEGSVRLWSLTARTALTALQDRGAYTTSVAFSPDGRLIATGGNDRAVTLWNVTTRAKVATLGEHGSDVLDIAFSPDGRLLAAAVGDGTAVIWDVPHRTRMATLTGHRAALRTLAFSPDGRLLATGGLDREVILWDVTTLHPWATLTGHTDLILGLAFNPAGGTLASSAGDHTVIIWPIDPQRARTRIEAALNS